MGTVSAGIIGDGTNLRDELIDMRARGLTREVMAKKLGITVSSLKRMIKSLEIPRRASKRSKSSTGTGAIIVPVEDSRTVLEQAFEILGGRVSEIRGVGYTLDGRPCNTDRILEAAGLHFRDQKRQLN